jgi:hypothetical protein
MGDKVTIAKAVYGLIPKPGENGGKRYNWDRFVFVMGVVICLAGSFHVSQSLGWLSPLGFSAFATSDEVRAVEVQVIQNREELEASRLQDTVDTIRYNRRLQCEAIYGDPPAPDEAYERFVSQGRVQYRRLTGVEYQLAPCSDYVRVP